MVWQSLKHRDQAAGIRLRLGLGVEPRPSESVGPGTPSARALRRPHHAAGAQLSANLQPSLRLGSASYVYTNLRLGQMSGVAVHGPLPGADLQRGWALRVLTPRHT